MSLCVWGFSSVLMLKCIKATCEVSPVCQWKVTKLTAVTVCHDAGEKNQHWYNSANVCCSEQECWAFGIAQLASSVLFCVCLRWAGCHSPYWNWRTGAQLSVLMYHRLLADVFVSCFQMSNEYGCSLFFSFYSCLESIKLWRLWSILILFQWKPNNFPHGCRHWTLFAWRVTAFPFLPECKNFSSSCDHRFQPACLISINLVRPF